MSINGTRGAPHHVEHWSIGKDLTPEEVSTYVHDTFGAGAVSHPVGFTYGPTGELQLFFQVATQRSKPIGEHAAEHARKAREEHRAKLKTSAESPVKPNVAPVSGLPDRDASLHALEYAHTEPAPPDDAPESERGP